jgi:hypothetical protein
MKRIKIDAKLEGTTVELELTPKQRQEFIKCLEREGKFALKLEKVTEMTPGGTKVSSVVVD